MCEICSKLTIKRVEQRRRSGTFIVNFEHISHLVLVFGQVSAGWVITFKFDYVSASELNDMLNAVCFRNDYVNTASTLKVFAEYFA